MVSKAGWGLGNVALISRPGPTGLPEPTYREASRARVPALTGRTLETHVGGLEAQTTGQGAGEGRAGSLGLTYLLPRLARPALRSRRALQEAKHVKVDRVLRRTLLGPGPTLRGRRKGLGPPSRLCRWEN